MDRKKARAWNVYGLATSLFVFIVPAISMAETWTSPDGLLKVTAPDSAQFVPIQELPPLFLALWVSNDESMKFAVVKVELPKNTPRLIQSSVEEGLANEAQGKVVRLPTRTVSGHEVWNMKASGPAGEMLQAFIRHDDVIYKLMAATPTNDAAAQSAQQFIDSLSLTQPVISLPAQPRPQDPQRDDLNLLSQKLGGFGGMLVIGLLIYFATRGKKKLN